MKITAYKTHKITEKDNNLFKILDHYLPKIKERSVVVVTSKIVAICEGSMIKIGKKDKKELIKKESSFYLPSEKNKYGVMLTIKNNMLLASAGIDESNSNNHYVLLPTNPQKSANEIRSYLMKKFSLKHVGVIITDSKTSPLRWGVTGIGIAHSGFHALNNYIGQEDLFGRTLKMTKVNVLDGLAVSAVLVMGEGKEQTPLAVIEDIPFAQFQKGNPTKQQLHDLIIEPKDDLYHELLEGVQWKKGEG